VGFGWMHALLCASAPAQYRLPCHVTHPGCSTLLLLLVLLVGSRPLPGASCGHTCTLLCHPGPCPPCPRVVDAPCHCGKLRLRQRCGQAAFSCAEVCGRRLGCGHACPEVCHEGPCPPCQQVRHSKVSALESADACCCFHSAKSFGRQVWTGAQEAAVGGHMNHLLPCPTTSRQLVEQANLNLRMPCLYTVSHLVVQLPCTSMSPPPPCFLMCGCAVCRSCGDLMECVDGARRFHDAAFIHVIQFALWHRGAWLKLWWSRMLPPGARTCPCGKTPYPDLPCDQASPSCGSTCGKLLSCGAHSCAERCHTGPCPAVGAGGSWGCLGMLLGRTQTTAADCLGLIDGNSWVPCAACCTAAS
jgi:NF-X1-type zinc finger protein NFXL1